MEVTCSDWSNNSSCSSPLVWYWLNHVNPLNGSETDHFNTQDIKYFITHSSANKSPDLFLFLEKYTIYWTNKIYKHVEKSEPIAILSKIMHSTQGSKVFQATLYASYNVLSDCTATLGHSGHFSMSANWMGSSFGLWPRVFRCWTLMRAACAGELSQPAAERRTL